MDLLKKPHVVTLADHPAELPTNSQHQLPDLLMSHLEHPAQFNLQMTAALLIPDCNHMRGSKKQQPS